MHYERLRAEMAEPCSAEGCEKPGATRGMCSVHYQEVRNLELGPCSVDGCSNISHGIGLCMKHYQRFINNGDPEVTMRPRSRLCSVEGCERKHMSNGFCGLHGHRHRAGLPMILTGNCDECGEPIDYHIVDGVAMNPKRKYCGQCDPYRDPNPITSAELVMRDQSWECSLCGEDVLFNRSWPHPLSPSVDHVIPLSRGGENVPENCQLAHLSCNVRKHNRLPEELELTA